MYQYLNDIQKKSQRTHFDGCLCILEGIEPRHHQLLSGIGKKPEGVTKNNKGGSGRRNGVKFPSFKKKLNNRRPKNDQSYGCRQDNEENAP